MKTYKEIITEMILEKINAAGLIKNADLKKDRDYFEFYERYKSYFFEFMVFSRLGTSEFEIPNNSTIEEDIEDFVNVMSLADFRNVIFIESEPIDVFVRSIVDSDNFILFNIVNQEVMREVEEYVAAGHFTKREEILIDYLRKTKASGVESFLIHSIYGGSAICHNRITCSGMVESVEEGVFVSDIEAIEKVTDGDIVIYEKSIL